MFYFKNCICNYLFLLHFILTYLSFPVTFSLVHFSETDERENNSSCVQLRLADSSLSFMYSDLLFPSIKPAIYFSPGPFIHLKSFTSVSAGACNFPIAVFVAEQGFVLMKCNITITFSLLNECIYVISYVYSRGESLMVKS